MVYERMIIGVFWDNYKLKNISTINEKLSKGYEVERVDALPVSNTHTDVPTLIYVLKREEINICKEEINN